jgi:hypothetical protein
MEYLSPQELAHESCWISINDLIVLVHNVVTAEQNKHVGFEHHGRTLKDMLKVLNRRARIRVSDLESALWSANLLDEQGKFWHMYGKTFEEWVKELNKEGVFEREYNWFKENR